MINPGFSTATCLACEQGDGFKPVEQIKLPASITGDMSGMQRTYGTTREDLINKKKKGHNRLVNDEPREIPGKEITNVNERTIESSWKKNPLKKDR